MDRYQLVDIETGHKRNVILWDGVADYQPPEGQRIEPDDRAPLWSEAPTGEATDGADSPTNSDWRVGLILWGRFAEVEAKVIAARDSGSLEGAIVWQRWEYANNVHRAELMELRETFGFSAADVDESLLRAEQVKAATLARAA